MPASRSRSSHPSPSARTRASTARTAAPRLRRGDRPTPTRPSGARRRTPARVRPTHHLRRCIAIDGVGCAQLADHGLLEHLVQRHPHVRNGPRREPGLQQVGLPTRDALRLQRSRRQLADRVGDPIDALAVCAQVEARTRCRATTSSHHCASSATVASRWNVDDWICVRSSNFTALRVIASSRVLPRTRLGRALPGATNVARHEPSASRYTEPSPFDALPCTRTLPSRLTLRLPFAFRAVVRIPPKPGARREQRAPNGSNRSNPGSETLQRQWTSTQRKACSEHLRLYFGEHPRTPVAEREGFEPPGREPFRFQGGCIWPLCHRSVGHAIPHPLARS